ncbi:MAG: cytochrome c oxidase assembly protein, partial [Paracoccaceae bacterium]|nr:cytochrome c oxidase assembly protein [Paracoccaceae bacterium]
MTLFPKLQGPQRTVAQTVSVVVFMGGLAWA